MENVEENLRVIGVAPYLIEVSAGKVDTASLEEVTQPYENQYKSVSDYKEVKLSFKGAEYRLPIVL